jgi:hypothetical protein
MAAMRPRSSPRVACTARADSHFSCGAPWRAGGGTGLLTQRYPSFDINLTA